MAKYEHAREFITEVFPDTKVEARPEELTIPEDVVPLYKAWCYNKGKEV